MSYRLAVSNRDGSVIRLVRAVRVFDAEPCAGARVTGRHTETRRRTRSARAGVPAAAVRPRPIAAAQRGMERAGRSRTEE